MKLREATVLCDDVYLQMTHLLSLCELDLEVPRLQLASKTTEAKEADEIPPKLIGPPQVSEAHQISRGETVGCREARRQTRPKRLRILD